MLTVLSLHDCMDINIGGGFNFIKSVLQTRQRHINLQEQLRVIVTSVLAFVLVLTCSCRASDSKSQAFIAEKRFLPRMPLSVSH